MNIIYLAAAYVAFQQCLSVLLTVSETLRASHCALVSL